MYHHTTTSTATTAIPKTTLDSRAQPVATEHAVPTSTQFSTLSFVMCTVVYEAQTSIGVYTISPKRAAMGSAFYLLSKEVGGAL